MTYLSAYRDDCAIEVRIGYCMVRGIDDVSSPGHSRNIHFCLELKYKCQIVQ